METPWSLGNPLQCLTTFTVEEFFLVFRLNFMWLIPVFRKLSCLLWYSRDDQKWPHKDVSQLPEHFWVHATKHHTWACPDILVFLNQFLLHQGVFLVPNFPSGLRGLGFLKAGLTSKDFSSLLFQRKALPTWLSVQLHSSVHVSSTDVVLQSSTKLHSSWRKSRPEVCGVLSDWRRKLYDMSTV